MLLEVLEASSFDYLESGYLVPYGVAAGIASRLMDLPHIARHGGSDLEKLLPHPQYRELLARTLREAEKVVTDEQNEPVVRATGARTEVASAYEPDRRVFAPRVASSRPDGRKVHAYIGKINYHWRRRGLDKIVDWYARQESGKVVLRVVGQGRGQTAFEDWCIERIGCAIDVERFVPPWGMPRLLSGIDSLFQLSIDDPIANPSNLAAEARQMGIEVVSSI